MFVPSIRFSYFFIFPTNSCFVPSDVDLPWTFVFSLLITIFKCKLLTGFSKTNDLSSREISFGIFMIFKHTEGVTSENFFDLHLKAQLIDSRNTVPVWMYDFLFLFGSSPQCGSSLLNLRYGKTRKSREPVLGIVTEIYEQESSPFLCKTFQSPVSLLFFPCHLVVYWVDPISTKFCRTLQYCNIVFWGFSCSESYG